MSARSGNSNCNFKDGFSILVVKMGDAGWKKLFCASKRKMAWKNLETGAVMWLNPNATTATNEDNDMTDIEPLSANTEDWDEDEKESEFPKPAKLVLPVRFMPKGMRRIRFGARRKFSVKYSKLYWILPDGSHTWDAPAPESVTDGVKSDSDSDSNFNSSESESESGSDDSGSSTSSTKSSGEEESSPDSSPSQSNAASPSKGKDSSEESSDSSDDSSTGDDDSTEDDDSTSAGLTGDDPRNN